MGWPIIITLDEAQVAEADGLARRRQADAVRRGRIPGNNLTADWAEAMAIQTQGCRGERAAKEWLEPVKWNDFAEDIYNLADFEDWIDAKTIKRPDHKMIVQRNDNPDWAYLLVQGARHPHYQILGWMWGREAQAAAVTDPTGKNRGAHFVEQGWGEPRVGDRWRHPDSLLAELRYRQG